MSYFWFWGGLKTELFEKIEIKGFVSKILSFETSSQTLIDLTVEVFVLEYSDDFYQMYVFTCLALFSLNQWIAFSSKVFPIKYSNFWVSKDSDTFKSFQTTLLILLFCTILLKTL